MRGNLAGASLVLFGVSLLLLLLSTLFEPALAGLSLRAERIVALVLLVLPAAAGAIFGALSLARREGRTGLAITGMILNTLFALFHFLIVLFAG